MMKAISVGIVHMQQLLLCLFLVAQLAEFLEAEPISKTSRRYAARLDGDNIVLSKDAADPNSQVSALYEVDVEGWNYLELDGLSSNDFKEERFLAGFIEGYVTCTQLFGMHPE